MGQVYFLFGDCINLHQPVPTHQIVISTVGNEATDLYFERNASTQSLRTEIMVDYGAFRIQRPTPPPTILITWDGRDHDSTELSNGRQSHHIGNRFFVWENSRARPICTITGRTARCTLAAPNNI